MAILVIAEHDNASLKGDAEHRHRRAPAAATSTCWSPATTLRGAAQAASQIAGVAKVLHADAKASHMAWPRTSPRRCW
jgi:electron transfer flavoprotein alpha subunit